jgi:aminoglycoside 2''-phosphotransferase
MTVHNVIIRRDEPERNGYSLGPDISISYNVDMKKPEGPFMNSSDVAERLRKQWHGMPSGPVEFYSAGWDNCLFLADHKFIVRVPRSARGRVHLHYEMAKLSRLHVPVPIPQYCWKAEWAGVYPLLGGQPVSRKRLAPASQREMAVEMSAFLTALHDPEHLPQGSQPNRIHWQWQRRFMRFQQELEISFYPLLNPRETRKIRECFSRCVEGPERFMANSALLHGDLSVEHILAGDGDRVAGVIDFGDMCVGDPIYDWAGLPSLWDGDILADLNKSEKVRRAFYRTLIPVHGFLHAVEIGDVQLAEQRIQRFRKSMETLE